VGCFELFGVGIAEGLPVRSYVGVGDGMIEEGALVIVSVGAPLGAMEGSTVGIIVGMIVGFPLGEKELVNVGFADGVLVGMAVGPPEGFLVGLIVGVAEGSAVTVVVGLFDEGFAEGDRVGFIVLGSLVGMVVGTAEGPAVVGSFEGAADGKVLGRMVGDLLGFFDGMLVGLPLGDAVEGAEVGLVEQYRLQVCLSGSHIAPGLQQSATVLQKFCAPTELATTQVLLVPGMAEGYAYCGNSSQ